MLRAKDWILLTGVVIACLGFQCLPHGQTASAKLGTSLFEQSSGSGAYLSFGFLTLAVGVLIVFVSFFLPKR